jgi:hypothetical protein
MQHHPRDALCARAMRNLCPSDNRGRRESRMLVAPAASRAKMESTRVSHHRLDRIMPAFPARMVLTACFVLSPVTGLSCHRRLRDLGASDPTGPTSPSASLAPASGRQDHTTSPSAQVLLVFQHRRVHRIPLPTSVTIAIRPSCGGGTRRSKPLICPTQQADYFSREDWTGRIALKRRGKFAFWRKAISARDHAGPSPRALATLRKRLNAVSRLSTISAATSSGGGNRSGSSRA